eukprot:4039162-Amphidinium_carterae.1
MTRKSSGGFGGGFCLTAMGLVQKPRRPSIAPRPNLLLCHCHSLLSMLSVLVLRRLKFARMGCKEVLSSTYIAYFRVATVHYAGRTQAEARMAG